MPYQLQVSNVRTKRSKEEDSKVDLPVSACVAVDGERRRLPPAAALPVDTAQAADISVPPTPPPLRGVVKYTSQPLLFSLRLFQLLPLTPLPFLSSSPSQVPLFHPGPGAAVDIHRRPSASQIRCE